MCCLRLYSKQACVSNGIRCNCGKKTLVDSLGHHFISGCPKDGFIKRQHDNLVHEFKKLFEWAGLQTIREETYCFTQVHPEKQDRPDLSLPHPPKRDKKLLLDVVISNPVEGSQNAVPKIITKDNALKINAANQTAVIRKNTHYQQMSADNALGFLPLAFESTGRIHPDSMKFIKDVAHYAEETRKINYVVCLANIICCWRISGRIRTRAFINNTSVDITANSLCIILYYCLSSVYLLSSYLLYCI